MKSILLGIVIVLFGFASADEADMLTCSVTGQPIEIPWIDMQPRCISQTKQQIKMEIDAALTYLAMGAHFSKDGINRPGFAEFFFKAAGEEREHGMKLIEYLDMRGLLTDTITDLISITPPLKTSWASGVDALEDALRKEVSVTNSIRDLISVCESEAKAMDAKGKKKEYNDYHFVDYLTGTYLEEQYHGQRELAGKISTLKKMMGSHRELGEFLYDKKM